MPTETKRTFALRIDCERDTDYGLRVERETLREYDDGCRYRIATRAVTRKLSLLAACPLPAGPVKIATYADLHAVIAACADALAAEDEATEAAKAKAAAEAAKKVAATKSVAERPTTFVKPTP